MILNNYRNKFIDKINPITECNRKMKYGEVFTPCNVVLYMLHLIGIDRECNYQTKIFEPGCGKGNFLIEILNYKLQNIINVINKNIKRDQTWIECLILLAISSIYGCDINNDNLNFTRNRLLSYVKKFCLSKLKIKPTNTFLVCLEKLLSLTIFKLNLLDNIKIIEKQLPIFKLIDKQIFYCYYNCFLNAYIDDNDDQESLFDPQSFNSRAPKNKWKKIEYNKIFNFIMHNMTTSKLGRERESINN